MLPSPNPTLLDHILDADLLATMIDDGYIRAQQHPRLPLTIFGYTEKTQFEQVWNDATLACRGLIVHAPTGQILARPFTKFFNHGQPGAPLIALDAPVTVTDKADGSLGIIHPTDDGWAVATRGSFSSDQALHATALLRQRYPDWSPPDGLTVLVEIVYPGNRIVIDYAGLDDLILLGAVEIATGRSFGPAAVPDWPGPAVEIFEHATLAEALAAPPRPGREGLVIHFSATDTRLKIKYEEYIRLHRIVTGLNARVVWELLAAGQELAPLIETLPDEFHPWVETVAAQLHATVAIRVVEVEATFVSIVEELPEGCSRKDFALRAAQHPDRGCLFLRLDERDYRPLLWQQIKPAPDWTPSESA